MTPIPTRASTPSDAAVRSQPLSGSPPVLQFGQWGADRYLGKRSGANRGRRGIGGGDGGVGGGGEGGGGDRDHGDRGGPHGRGAGGRGTEGGGGGVLERPARCSDYRAKYADRSDAFVVIDNGSHRCRIGWAPCGVGAGWARDWHGSTQSTTPHRLVPAHPSPSADPSLRCLLASSLASPSPRPFPLSLPSPPSPSASPLCHARRWGGEADPRVDFRSVVGRPRPRSGGERWGEENGGTGGSQVTVVATGTLLDPCSCTRHPTATHLHLPSPSPPATLSPPPHPTPPRVTSGSQVTVVGDWTPRSQVTVVGDWDPAWPALRALEFGRQSIRSPFESNVIYNFELMECIFDYAFDRLGVEGGGRVNHPVLLTEAPCAPLYTRGKTAELMFETYGVPALAFGVDGVFSYRHNTAQHHSVPDGLLVNCGHSTTHVMPMIAGQPLLDATCRIPVGGWHVTDYLKRLLTLLYPQHASVITWERAEEMKCRGVYVAIDYSQELKAFQSPAAPVVSWQLPWVAPVAPQGPSEEEVARRTANKERAGQRLRDMAAAKRAAKRAAELEEVEGEVEGLRAVIEDVEDGAEGREAIMLLSRVRCATLSEARGKLAKCMATLRKLRGEEGEGEGEGEEGEGEGEEGETGSVAGGAEEQDESVLYPLLDIPDAELTAEELREKRRQRTMRGIALGQARMRQAAEEKRAKAAAERDEEERKRRENPEAYAAELRARFQQLQVALEQRKRRKMGAGGVVLGAAASPSVGGEESGGKGMGSEGGASGGEAVGVGGAVGAAAAATAATAATAAGVGAGAVSVAAASPVLSLAAAAAAAASGQAVKGATLDITPLGGPAGALAGATGVGLGGALAGSVAGGRTERITAAHRERMKLLTAAAFESEGEGGVQVRVRVGCSKRGTAHDLARDRGFSEVISESTQKSSRGARDSGFSEVIFESTQKSSRGARDSGFSEVIFESTQKSSRGARDSGFSEVIFESTQKSSRGARDSGFSEVIFESTQKSSRGARDSGFSEVIFESTQKSSRGARDSGFSEVIFESTQKSSRGARDSGFSEVIFESTQKSARGARDSGFSEVIFESTQKSARGARDSGFSEVIFESTQKSARGARDSGFSEVIFESTQKSARGARDSGFSEVIFESTQKSARGARDSGFSEVIFESTQKSSRGARDSGFSEVIFESTQKSARGARDIEGAGALHLPHPFSSSAFVVQLIKTMSKHVRQRESERAERATLVTQEKLQLSKGRPPRLPDLWIRPSFGGKGRKLTGSLEAHLNGFRYSTAKPDERVEVMYGNIKHAFFQPAENEMITLLHFHLHNPPHPPDPSGGFAVAICGELKPLLPLFPAVPARAFLYPPSPVSTLLPPYQPDERVEVMYGNIKHAFFQPAENEMITLLHFHLHNPIMVGKKKTKDMQFFAEVMEVVQTVGGSRRSAYDPDEIEEEQRERERRSKINREFKSFVSAVHSLWEKDRELARLDLEFDVPFRELGFHGVPHKSSAFIVPTVNCLVELIEVPFLVVTLNEVEIVNLERVGLGQKTFDMAIVFKDFKRDVLRIDAIPSTSLDSVKEWLNSMNIKYYESRLNLSWKAILQNIMSDPEAFLADGGWEFLNLEASDSEGEESEESQAYEPSDLEEAASDDDDDESEDDESVVDSEEEEGEEEEEEEEEGPTS
ncbi:unnamed protein product [Closterium sp. Naga37s-1]|nr:unnamed protein product [Closterium sp. Naga37s-1]